MSVRATKTINPLHFTDLDPMRFEDLCLHLVSKIYKWKELNHFGRKGQDGGVDIHGIESLIDEEKVWFIQCKRYSNLTKAHLEEVVKKATKIAIPDKLLLIAACNVSRNQYDHFKLCSQNSGIKESEIWTASTLQTKLYNYKDLLFIYFGLQLENKEMSGASKIRYSLKMEKRMRKDLINHKFFKENFQKVLHDPMLQFISNRVIIHSVDDMTYPTVDPNINTWYREHLYNFYHNGIELWLGATLGGIAIMDNKGYWEPTNYFDERKNNGKYKTIEVKTIGQIPFYNIVDYKLFDEYYSEPHIYCKFDLNGEPFERIYYRLRGNLDGSGDYELDESMKTKFPKKL
jgi:hypothetical protein